MYQCFLLTPVFYGVRVVHLFSFLYYFFIVVSLCSVSCVAFVSDLSIRDSIWAFLLLLFEKLNLKSVAYSKHWMCLICDLCFAFYCWMHSKELFIASIQQGWVRAYIHREVSGHEELFFKSLTQGKVKYKITFPSKFQLSRWGPRSRPNLSRRVWGHMKILKYLMQNPAF